MTQRQGIAGTCCALALVAAGSSPEAAIVKTLDRKFPTGQFCPLESRAEAGVDLSFVAPASTVRITFSGANLDSSGEWNALQIDNVAVVAKSVFDASLVSDIPQFAVCYLDSVPPGQTEPGIPNAPAYDFAAVGTTEVLLDLFPSGLSGWTGEHVTFDPGSTAPTDPASGTGFTGGSLALGQLVDGAVAVSASKIVSGLTPGAPYVVFAWWSSDFTNPLAITIGVPCADQDGDGFVVCGACDLAAGETCGDCDESNPHCATSCVDSDGDGWCPAADCDDGAAGCTADCETDLDADGTADCRDGCVDEDGDGYGTAGGAQNTCLGTDCSPTNRFCNVSCVDADGDGHCPPGDCVDSSPAIADDLAEINDCADQQCPGNLGHGVFDEISGTTGFLSAGDKNTFSWPHQSLASNYLVVRSSSPTFPPACVSTGTSFNTWTDAATPAPGEGFYYLVRALAACKGSFGQGASGLERAAICGEETACGNGVDDDVDGATDCADPDCGFTAPCRVQNFAFTDTEGDDVAIDALWQFFEGATAGVDDYIFFEIVEGSSRLAWCSQNAGFYQTHYLLLAPAGGSATSGSWSKWRKTPATGDAWQGPDTTGHLNEFGTDAGFSEYVWCSEQFSPSPKNCIFPHNQNDCEAYDLASGACGASVGQTWQLTIRIASTRVLACGF